MNANIKLYGKELDDELAKRKRAKESRLASKISIRQAAKKLGIKPSEFLAIENGSDICPHLEYEDSADFHRMRVETQTSSVSGR